MVRTPSCDKSGLRKGTWTPEEDRKLIAYVTRYGSWNWRQLPRFAGLARCGKSCRLRWMNYLRPNLKRGNFTEEEEECIIKLHTKLGNRWSAIAAELPGRTDNEIKNHWHTTLKKRFQTNEEQSKASKSKDKETTQEKDKVPNNNDYCTFQVTPVATYSQISDSTTAPLSPLSSSSELSSITSLDQTTAASNENLVIEDDDFAFLDGSFWAEPYLAEILHTPSDHELVPSECNNGAFQSAHDTTTTQVFYPCAISVPSDESSSASLVDLENEFGSLLEPTVESFWTQPHLSDASHLPSELLTPYVAPSEYFSTLCGADLWSTQSNLYDQQLGLF